MIRPICFLCVVSLAVAASRPTTDAATAPQENAARVVAKAKAAPVVVVYMKDGQVVRGRVDAHTTADRLCVRWTAAGIVVRSRLAWSQIDHVWYGGQRFTAGEFSPIAQTIRTEAPPGAFQPPPPDEERLRQTPGEGPSGPQPPSALRRPGRRSVASLKIEATPANWDTDVETDGLELRLMPRDQHANVVPVRGTVTAELWGQRLEEARPRRPFRPIGRWCIRISAEDFDLHGALCHLEYQAVHPEFDRNYRSEGLLHVTLGVPGQGNVDASAPVWLQPLEPLRDHLELLDQRRFFPGEPTARR